MAEDQPDVYLVGESHDIPDYGDFEAQVIDDVDPEYVMAEGVKAENEQYLRYNIEGQLAYRTLFDAQKAYSSDHDGPILEHDPDELIDKARERVDAYSDEDSSGVVPEDRDELLTTPFYELHPAVLSTVIDEVEQRAREERAEGNIDRAAQLEDITNIYEPALEKKQDETQSTGIARLFDYLGREGGVTVTALDSKEEAEQYAEAVAQGDEEAAEEYNRERESSMAERIKEYAEKADRPVVAIMGRDHAAEGSHLRERLEEEGIEYETVAPQDYGFNAREMVDTSLESDTGDEGIQHISMEGPDQEADEDATGQDLDEQVENELDIEQGSINTPRGLIGATIEVIDRYKNRASTAYRYGKRILDSLGGSGD